MLSWLRAKVGSDLGKDPEIPSHVGDEKTNISEPLLTHRNRTTLTSKPGIEGFSEIRKISEARERPKCGYSDVRCQRSTLKIIELFVGNLRSRIGAETGIQCKKYQLFRRIAQPKMKKKGDEGRQLRLCKSDNFLGRLRLVVAMKVL